MRINAVSWKMKVLGLLRKSIIKFYFTIFNRSLVRVDGFIDFAIG